MEIKATIIADSISQDAVRITTYELEYPRFIHSELMTHRVFSRNAASSRAIPVATMMKNVQEDPAMPVQWGVNQPGMQASVNLEGVKKNDAIVAWHECAAAAVRSAEMLHALGLHKQIVNRVLEPFQMMKTIVTATEYENFFALRCHEDAQPEIHVLADLMADAMANSQPKLLTNLMWHLPYVELYICPEYGNYHYHLDDEDQTELTLNEARKVSASCCAQVSYRKNDTGIEKALVMFQRLVGGKPAHASPFEHQAHPCDKDYWHGNFRGWVQFRKILGL